MKKKSIIGLFVALFGFGMTTTSCEDMLTPDVENIAEGFTGTDTVGFYFGILSNLQDVYENNILLGDLRSDLVETTPYVSDSVADVANFVKVEDADNGLLTRAAYYKVINQCNFYLAKVDTMIMKNNNYYMRREFSQVQIIRAWTYMQLVQNYGKVPFITEPVDNANTGWETNPKDWATADNLLDLLQKNGLNQAYEYEKTLGSIDYHTMSNGKFNMSHKLSVFPADLVMGDLYLLRGANKADFERAATYYYDYLEEQTRLHGRVVSATGSDAARQNKSTVGGRDYYTAYPANWATTFMDLGKEPSVNAEVSTLVLSAANSTFGNVMTRTSQIYGFDASSSNSTASDGAMSGQVILTPNYRNRQITASKGYTNLSKSQIYREEVVGATGQVADVKYPENVGDARISGTVIKVNTDVGTQDFVQKRGYYGYTSSSLGVSVYAGAFTFNYTFPVYRMRQIYLRYAEAINRAGYPRHAFALLRDGLTSKTIPSVRYDSIHVDSLPDGTIISQTVVPTVAEIEDGCTYIGADELRRAKDVPFLDFSQEIWDRNSGIHEFGSGQSSDRDTLYTYDLIVGKRMADEAARVAGSNVTESAVKRYVKLLQEEGEGGEGGEETVDPTAPVTPDPVIPENIGEQINAVETLIADEMALETAFEGTRFYDLTRIARHKNNDAWGFSSGDYGTGWFAWTIARRNVDLAPYVELQQKDESLYSKLLNIENWYLQNPVY